MDPHPPQQDHLSDEQLVAYVGGSLPSEERQAAIEHLAECAKCRDEALAIARLLRRERTRKIVRVGTPVATAAALGFALLVLVPGSPFESGEPILREGAPAVGPGATIAVYSPRNTAETGPLEFSWQDMGSEVRYRLSLTRSDGGEVWSDATADTSLVLPPDVTLVEGTTYFWWVDALLLDGRSVTTDVQQLTIVP
jgi:hypothetical protein